MYIEFNDFWIWRKFDHCFSYRIIEWKRNELKIVCNTLRFRKGFARNKMSKNCKLCVKLAKWEILIEWCNNWKCRWGIEILRVSCSVTLVGKFRIHLYTWDNDVVYEILTETYILLIELPLQMEKTVIIDKRLKLDH